MIGTAPCVTCGERITVDQPMCCWKRERVIWTPVAQLEPGDLICTDRDKPPHWKVLSVTEGVGSANPHWRFGWEVEAVRISGAHPPVRNIVPSHTRFYVPRVIACQNFACDLHRREVAPGRVICAECWPLQMAAIVGVAA